MCHQQVAAVTRQSCQSCHLSASVVSVVVASTFQSRSPVILLDFLMYAPYVYDGRAQDGRGAVWGGRVESDRLKIGICPFAAMTNVFISTAHTRSIYVVKHNGTRERHGNRRQWSASTQIVDRRSAFLPTQRRSPCSRRTLPRESRREARQYSAEEAIRNDI
jgi:hypothetical protein